MIKRLGIIGGGQLALMLIQSASKLGIDVITLDPNENCPAKKYSSHFINAEYSDVKALEKLFALSDQVIYEFENIDIASVEKLDQTKLYQGLELLNASQNRIREKNLARKSGLQTANFAKVTNLEELKVAVEKIGYPGILKTCELGYDGKGQLVLEGEADLKMAQEMLDSELIYEEKVTFDYELSVIAIRNKNDEIASFKPFINVHKNGILHETKSINIPENLVEETKELITKMMRNGNYYGILCIEFFVKGDTVYFNEMAPRPHNSGHVTIDSYDYSQFDLMIGAVAGFKLEDPNQLRSMRMFNLLGQHYDAAVKFCLENSFAKLYIYGKDGCAHNRKMGHINISDDKDLVNKLTREVFNYE